MVQLIRTDSDVTIDGKYGNTITYEIAAANEFLAERRVLANAVTNSPLSAGAVEIIESERVTPESEPLQEFRMKVFIPNETIVQRLGAERAKDGLRELGIIGEK